MGGRFEEGGSGSGKLFYEFFLSIIKKIIVHNFDCIKSRIPKEVVLYSSGNLWDFARNH